MSPRLSITSIVIVILLAVFVTSNHAAIRETTVQNEVPAVKGELKVSYALFNPDGSNGSNTVDQVCSEIEFHTEYLVTKGKAGGGQVIPTARIKTFTWTGK